MAGHMPGRGKRERRRVHAPNEWQEKAHSSGKLTPEEWAALTIEERLLRLGQRVGLVSRDGQQGTTTHGRAGGRRPRGGGSGAGR